jgi:hypothetical protein
MAKLTHTVYYGTSTTCVDMPGVWPPGFYLPGNLVTFRVLEPYAMKVASTVLRRERRGNPPDLSDKTLRRNINKRKTIKNQTANVNKALMPACQHKSQHSRQAKELNLPTHSHIIGIRYCNTHI